VRHTIRRHALSAACAAASAWSLLVLLAPFLGSRAGRGSAGLGLAVLAYLAGGIVCHQQPARSFELAGAPLPVCARCSGLYLAGASGLLITALLARTGRESQQRDNGVSWRVVLAAAAVPMALSLVLEWVGVWAGTNGWRAASAVPLGLAGGVLIGESLSFRGRL
jgi:uncharacterized membrane protein